MKLEIKDLHVETGGKKIIKGLDLELNSGETTALMGPNGSGKSTLANVLMGHPDYAVSKGRILFNGIDITKLTPEKRAALGLFLGFQYPVEVPGVSMTNFLRMALNANRKAKNEELLSVSDFHNLLKEKIKQLHIEEKFMDRYLNEGFSGGEKKKAEILQMAVLNPQFAILDETDSGLDIDALKVVSNGINRIKKENKSMGVLLITHYQRILHYIRPDKVHVMISGKIVTSGGKELAEKLEKEGYDWIIKEQKGELMVIS